MIKEMRSHPFTLIVVLGLVLFSWYAYLNFAKAAEVSAVNEKVEAVDAKIDVMIELQLSSTLRSLAQDLCKAENKSTLQRIYDEKARQYRRLTGSAFIPPPCEE